MFFKKYLQDILQYKDRLSFYIYLSLIVHYIFFFSIWIVAQFPKKPKLGLDVTASLHFIPASKMHSYLPTSSKDQSFIIDKPVLKKPTLKAKKFTSQSMINRPAISSRNNRHKIGFLRKNNLMKIKNNQLITPDNQTKKIEEEDFPNIQDVENFEENFEEEIKLISSQNVNTTPAIDDANLINDDNNLALSRGITTSHQKKFKFKNDRLHYQATLAQMVKLYWKIPNTRQIDFIIEIEVLINSQGKVINLKFIKQSKITSLNEAARQAIIFAAPFPSFPDSFDQQKKFLAHFRFDSSEVNFW